MVVPRAGYLADKSAAQMVGLKAAKTVGDWAAKWAGQSGPWSAVTTVVLTVVESVAQKEPRWAVSSAVLKVAQMADMRVAATVASLAA